MGKTDRPVVLLLFGGQSSEHEISCATAAGVLAAIDPNRWDVVAVGITPGGQWVPQPADPSIYQLGDERGYTVQAAGEQVSLLTGPDYGGRPRLVEFSVDESGQPVPGSLRPGKQVDVVFPLLHGPFGEDGTVQGLLEMAPVRYVGCGVAASAVAMDKRLTKTVLSQEGLPTGRWEAFNKRQWEYDSQAVLERLGKLGLPVFVKPARAGSSMGITRVTSEDDLRAAIELAQQHDPMLIVEAANPGRELECGILALPEGGLVASPLGEIVVEEGDFYDYESKYFATEGVRLICPADVDEKASDQMREAAKVAFELIGGEGLARVDFFYDQAAGDFIINEINTMPGFTPYSMYPRVLQAAGYGYPQLIEVLLSEALQRPTGLR